MEITDNKPILRQVSDYCRRLILRGEWPPGQFIASTKELALRLGVNPRTVMKAYDELAAADVIINRRGQGYVVADDGPGLLHDFMVKEFEDEVVPDILRRMDLCGISPDDLHQMLQTLLDNGTHTLSAD